MKKSLTVIMIAILATLFISAPTFAVDPICSKLTQGTEEYITAGCDAPADPSADAFATFRTVMNSIYFAVAIAAVGVIIFGGFRYAISQGDPGKVKKAKDTILYAIIGLVVVLSAFTITNFILGVI